MPLAAQKSRQAASCALTALASVKIAFTIATASVAIGEDWPAWGGSDPGRNMYSPAKGIPAKFKAGDFKKATEGYEDEFGDKDVYKDAYRSSYLAGYRAGFESGSSV